MAPASLLWSAQPSPGLLRLTDIAYPQGVGGGAWYPPAQGVIADKNTAHSYMVPFSGYVAMTVYAVYVHRLPYIDPQCLTLYPSL